MRAKFNFLGINPPSNLYVPAGQALQLTLWSLTAATTVTLVIRILRTDGEIREISRTVALPANAAANNTIIPLTECFILSASLTCAALGIIPNGIYATVHLINGVAASSTRIQQLIGGHVTFATALSYPTCPVRPSTDVTPPIISEAIAAPAAGDPIDYNPVLGDWLRMVCIQFRVITSAVVANRRFYVIISRPGGIVQRCASLSLQTASQNITYIFHSNKTPGGSLSMQYETLSPDLTISSLDELFIQSDVFDAGDQIDNCILTYEKRLLI